MGFERGKRVQQRLTADGVVNGGSAILRLIAVGAKAGGTAGVLEWYEDTSAGTAGNKRGGLSVPINSWAWVTNLDEGLSALFADFDANITEAVFVYIA